MTIEKAEERIHQLEKLCYKLRCEYNGAGWWDSYCLSQTEYPKLYQELVDLVMIVNKAKRENKIMLKERD